MKYVACWKPDINLDGWDWVYTLTEDRRQNYEFYLIEAKSPKAAREIAVDAFYETAMQNGGLNYIILYAFEAFCSLELEDEEIVQFLGPKDGKTALEFYAKYTWEAINDGKIEFYDSANHIGVFL